MDILRLLPDDEYQAAVGANAPTALNPFATIADLIPDTDTNIYNTDNSLTGNRIVTGAGSSLTFNAIAQLTINPTATTNAKITWSDGAGTPTTIVSGAGLNPTGFESASGVASYLSSPGVKGYGGLYDNATNTTAQWTVYDSAFGTDEAGFIARANIASGNSTISQLYHLEYGTGNYYGFEASVFGERILSQSAGLNRLSVLPAASGMTFLSGAGGTGFIGCVDQAGFINWMGASWPSTQSLADTLAVGNTTGANDIDINDGQKIIFNTVIFPGLLEFTATLSNATLSANHTYTLQDGTGTLAFLSDIPAPTPPVPITDDIIPRGTGTTTEDGTWSNVGNDIYPVTTGSNIGDATHRIGTIFMSSVLDYSTDLLFNSGSTRMTLSTIGNLGIGVAPPATTRLTVRGTGTTNATRTLLLESSAGNDRFIVNDDGQQAWGIGANATPNAQFGHVANVANYNYGFGFYATNCPTAGMLIAMGGTTRTGLSVSTQNAPVGGTVVSIIGNTLANASSINYGVQGLARNGSAVSVGVQGQVAGGATVTPSLYVAAVAGNAATNIDALQYGGYFISNSAFAGVKTKDIIAVFGAAANSTNQSGSTSTAIGAQFRTSTTGGGGSNKNMALNVPLTSNDGNVVIGANASSPNRTLVEVTGDIEIIGAGGGNGLILEAPDTTRYRVTVNNAGALVIAAA